MIIIVRIKFRFWKAWKRFEKDLVCISEALPQKASITLSMRLLTMRLMKLWRDIVIRLPLR